MDELIQKMKVYLASCFSVYLKAHNFHWNVEGINFNEMHAFLSDIYTDYYEAVDDIAEQIRQLGSYAPGSLARFKELTTIDDQVNAIQDAPTMLSLLRDDNQKIIELGTELSGLAGKEKKLGLQNYLQGKLMDQSKLAWKLNACLKA